MTADPVHGTSGSKTAGPAGGSPAQAGASSPAATDQPIAEGTVALKDSQRPETDTRPFDVQAIRAEIPVLCRELRPGTPLVYLDNAATSLKPRPVLRALAAYYEDYPANVHRGLHTLSERATEAYESVRQRVARFLGLPDSEQVIFTRGTTESVNLVAQTWGRSNLGAGDEIVLSLLEHHSNLVPWQMLAQEKGLALKFADIAEDGRLDLDSFEQQLTPRTRMVAVTGMSNVLGTRPPMGEIVRRARAIGARVLVDAAQSVPHGSWDLSGSGVDFVAFSGHKMCGPTGVGVLYAKRELLEEMPPYHGGGNMIRRVELTSSEWNEVPWKFEAGTPPIAEVIGLGAAVDYLRQFDPAALRQHEQELSRRAGQRLGEIRGLRVLGPAPEEKGGIVGFTLDGMHPHDLSQLIDRDGVAIRAGHHCAMPLHKRLGLVASARASFYLYNTLDEVDQLAAAIENAKRVFRLP